jgi:hypothetical protein
MFEEVAIMRLRDGRIADYREVANTGPGFVDMNSPQSASSKFCGAREMRLRPALKPPGIWLKPHPSQIEPAVSWNGRTPGRYWGDSLPPTGVRKVVQMTRSGNSVHRPMADGHRGREQRASFHAVGRIALDL